MERAFSQQAFPSTTEFGILSSVSAYHPHPAPAGDEREILRREIVTQAREIASRVPDGDEKDVDELIDEAFSAIRGRRG